MEQHLAAPTVELLDLEELSVTQVGRLVQNFLSEKYNVAAGQAGAAAFVDQNIAGNELGEYEVEDLQALGLTGPRARALYAEVARFKTEGVPADSA